MTIWGIYDVVYKVAWHAIYCTTSKHACSACFELEVGQSIITRSHATVVMDSQLKTTPGPIINQP